MAIFFLFLFVAADMELVQLYVFFLTGMIFSKTPGFSMQTVMVNLELHGNVCGQGLDLSKVSAYRPFGQWWVRDMSLSAGCFSLSSSAVQFCKDQKAVFG